MPATIQRSKLVDFCQQACLSPAEAFPASVAEQLEQGAAEIQVSDELATEFRTCLFDFCS